MARKALLGHKLRQLRRKHGKRQIETAQDLEISASYLYLIEHNRRPMTLPLLLKVARTFDVDIQVFSDDEEARLVADLKEALGDPLFGELELSATDPEELAGSMPTMGRAIIAVYTAYRNASENVQALSEQLPGNAVLSESIHELLTVMTSIRSFSEILHDNADLGSSQRQKFLQILVKESEQLSSTIDRFMDSAKEHQLEGLLDVKSPSDDVSHFIESHNNYFPDIEAASEALRGEILSWNADPREQLARILAKRHKLTVEIVPWNARQGFARRLDGKKNKLLLSEVLTPSDINFQIARQIALMSCGDIFERYLANSKLTSEEAQVKCRDALAKYFAGAVLMPYDAIFEASRELRYDIELLQRRFNTSFEQVCHRLTTLQRPGSTGVPIHIIQTDIAGNISHRFSASGLRIPRFGGACPRWNVHSAFMTPGTINTQVGRMPDGSTYFCLARTVVKPEGGFNVPRSLYAIALGCEISNAHQLVYADGADLDNMDAAVPIGINCRLCERDDCNQRAFPTIIRKK